MTSTIHLRADVNTSWQWPVNVNVYDRSGHLTPTEGAELANLMSRREAGASHLYRAAHHLQRLMHPIHDALDWTNAGRAKWDVLSILMQEMYHRNTTFWNWTPEGWAELICANSTDFEQRYHKPRDTRQYLTAVAFLLCNFRDLHILSRLNQKSLAFKIFGRAIVETNIQLVCDEVLRWGYGADRATKHLTNALCIVFLFNQSPHLEDLTPEVLEDLRKGDIAAYLKTVVPLLSRALASLGFIARSLAPAVKEGERFGNHDAQVDVPPAWLEWCRRWHDTSTLAPSSREGFYYLLLKAGRWLAQTHPEVVAPAQWTYELAAEYVAAVGRMAVGQWAKADKMHPAQVGKPLSARAKNHQLAAMRVFFRDCQEWNWISRRFNPQRCFATPRTIRALIAPNPRVISDDIWAKLLWSGLNLTADDVPGSIYQAGPRHPDQRGSWYPVEMIRGMTLVWLFAGLRSDEWSRLRVGCIRWQHHDLIVPGTSEVLPKDAVCLLSIPTHKTGTEFTKPVDRVVGEAITIWERVRPDQPAAVDEKTGELVHYLFSYRGKHVAKEYINATLIPMLCRKGGLARSDARGNITSHRARSTIASQLFNAKEPMSLFELQEWLGHRLLTSTQHYAKITPTKLAKAYADAGYFGRNVRTIEVLIDQDAVKSGAAAAGEPWRFYDLGHGYCLYEFFDACPHRMACAKCAFYRPKGSTQAQLLEGKANLLRMLQEIPLSEEERAAVEEGIEAMEKLCQQLADVPTPAGPTPNQLASERLDVGPIIPVERVRRKRQSR